MSRLRLSSRDRRALLAGALVLAPFFLIQYVARPYVVALSDLRGRLEVQQDLLRRELALLTEAPGYPDYATSAEATLTSVTSRLFSGPDEISTTGALVNYLGTVSEPHRVLLQRSETRGAIRTEEGVIVLSVGVRAVGDLQGLLGFLHSLETGDKLVRVEELAIERGRSVSISTVSDEEVLNFTAVVTGYALAESDERQSGDVAATVGGTR